MKSKSPLLTGFTFLLMLTILSCSKDDEPAQRTYSDIENDFSAFEVKAGTQELTLKITEDISYNFRVIFLDADLSNQWPMVMTVMWNRSEATSQDRRSITHHLRSDHLL
jgi:hypothetical protein